MNKKSIEVLVLEYFNEETTITPEFLKSSQEHYKTIVYESLEEWFGNDRNLILEILSTILFLQYKYNQRCIKGDCIVIELL